MKNTPAITTREAATYINQFLRLNRNTRYERDYAIANALKELARRNQARFTGSPAHNPDHPALGLLPL